MMDINLRMKNVTYSDCGVNGGRTTQRSDCEYLITDDFDPVNFMFPILSEMKEDVKSGKYPYEFHRLAVVFLALDGTMTAIAVMDDIWDEDGYYSVEIVGKDNEEEFFHYDAVGAFLSASNIQLYNIYQQVNRSRIKTLDYTVPDDILQNALYKRDSFRGLDVFGKCRIVKTCENRNFHDYIRYEIGEDYYIETYFGEATQTHEYWLCREFASKKLLIIAYDAGNMNRDGFLEGEEYLIIDRQIMELILELSDVHEYFFIDNNYQFTFNAIKCDDPDCECKHLS